MQQKRTKIVCTLGPATESVASIVSLGLAGMDIARFNFSHGSHEWHGRVLKRVRQAEGRVGRPIAILQDVHGRKIRVGNLPAKGIPLRAGHEIVFTTDPSPMPGDVPVPFTGLEHMVKRGARVLLDDGLLECVVRRVDGRRIKCEVVTGGTLLPHKGLNLPGTIIALPALTDQGREDARWGIKNRVDFVALSFIRSAQDAKDLRHMLDRSSTGKRIHLIGKIEKQEAVDGFDAILPHLDAVMIGRGDLGIETEATNLPVVQKQIVARCRERGVPVIVATQMLDSMQHNPRPTRAEVSDVANAVADHADAVMLSGETSSGKYPLAAVRVMADTIRATEMSPVDDLPQFSVSAERGVPEVLGATVRIVSDALGHAPIVALTDSGRTAREVSAFRPDAPIHAVTPDVTVDRQARLLWGVTPHVMVKIADPAKRVAHALALLVRRKAFRRGTRVVVVSGAGKPGSANRIEIMNA